MSPTNKQQMILDAIVYLIRAGEIPTVREVGTLVGLRSPATVLKHLRALEAEKLISMSGKSRGIRITDPDLLPLLPLDADKLRESGAQAVIQTVTSRGDNILQAHFSRLTAGVPIVGAIAAGHPIETRAEAFEPGNAIDGKQPSLAIDPRMFASSGDILALRIEGDSMINAGICDGDYAIIRRQAMVEQGEIAAVLINGEATLKRWYFKSGHFKSGHSKKAPHGNSFGGDSFGVEPSEHRNSRTVETQSKKDQDTVRLVAENDRFDPLEIVEADRKEVMIVGKYVGLVRGVQIV